MEKLRMEGETLAAGHKLAKRHRERGLTGNYAGFWECHIEADWLLIYRLEAATRELILVRTGSRSELFE